MVATKTNRFFRAANRFDKAAAPPGKQDVRDHSTNKENERLGEHDGLPKPFQETN